MDRKTLEYMEERAKKARAIVNQIEELLDRVSKVKRSRGVIDIYASGLTIRTINYPDNDLSTKDYETELAAHMYNTFISITVAEIQRLEQALAEL